MIEQRDVAGTIKTTTSSTSKYDQDDRLLTSSDSGDNSRAYPYDHKTGRLASYCLTKGGVHS